MAFNLPVRSLRWVQTVPFRSIVTLNIPTESNFSQTSQKRLFRRNPQTVLQSGTIARQTSRTVREHVKVYLPGEKVPSPKDRRVQEVVDSNLSAKAANSTLDVFNEVMLEATKSLRDRRFIVCEGTRLIEEAFKAGLTIHKLFLQKSIKDVPDKIRNFVTDQNIPLHHVSQKAMKNWSSLTTPPGIVGVFRKPKPGEIGTRRDELQPGMIMPVTVICDNVREPGNLGSILRSAAGAGCKRVLLSRGCCDPWDEKVLRAGCGAQFRLPITMNYPLYSLADCMEIENVGYEAAGAHSSCRDEAERDGNSRRTDNEATIDGPERSIGGKRKITSSLSSLPLPSPSPPPQPQPQPPPSPFPPMNQTECYPPPNSFALFLADSNDDMETDEKRRTLPIVSYTDVNYGAFENVYLVVGGETEGLSRDILQITSTLRNAPQEIVKATVARLRIPLHHQMDSLNASAAFSVIVYEMLRQHRLKLS